MAVEYKQINKLVVLKVKLKLARTIKVLRIVTVCDYLFSWISSFSDKRKISHEINRRRRNN